MLVYWVASTRTRPFGPMVPNFAMPGRRPASMAGGIMLADQLKPPVLARVRLEIFHGPAICSPRSYLTMMVSGIGAPCTRHCTG